VQRAVFAATLDILSRAGYTGFRIADVAMQAGVNETSIYRRWGTKDKLLLDALFDQATLDGGMPDTGQLCTDLIIYVSQSRVGMTSPLNITLIEIGVLSTQRHDLQPYRAVYWKRIVSASRPIKDRAIRRGELSSSADIPLLLELRIGPLFARVLMSGGSLNPAFAEAIVDSVLHNFAKS
jgi:AcrR family transcriptional regulator